MATPYLISYSYTVTTTSADSKTINISYAYPLAPLLPVLLTCAGLMIAYGLWKARTLLDLLHGTVSEKTRSIASYSLLIIGSYWVLFGTSALVSRGSSASYSSARPLFAVTIPLPGTVVGQADFTWNLVGAFLIILGILSYKYTREKNARYLTARRVAVIGTSILLFYGLAALNYSRYSYYLYCYTQSPAIPGVDCGDISTFPGIEQGYTAMVIGSVSFLLATLSNIAVAGLRRNLPLLSMTEPPTNRVQTNAWRRPTRNEILTLTLIVLVAFNLGIVLVQYPSILYPRVTVKGQLIFQGTCGSAPTYLYIMFRIGGSNALNGAGGDSNIPGNAARYSTTLSNGQIYNVWIEYQTSTGARSFVYAGVLQLNVLASSYIYNPGFVC